MVKLTSDLLVRCTSGHIKKRRDEETDDFLKRLTHLYLGYKTVDDVGNSLLSCTNLKVLYLYENNITYIPNLNQNHLLTHLYLQNNSITKIENLQNLQKLQKLYLGGNCISVVENLEWNPLQELHLENQRLHVGDQLIFDSKSIKALANSLQVLNICGNKIESIFDLIHLNRISQINVSDNQLRNLKELDACLNSFKNLLRLDLSNNPVCNEKKYRDYVIVRCPNLKELDGKVVTEESKVFLQYWHEKKIKKPHKNALQTEIPSDTIHRQNSCLGHIMPAWQKKEFMDLLAKSHKKEYDTDITFLNRYNTIHAMPHESPLLNTNIRAMTIHNINPCRNQIKFLDPIFESSEQKLLNKLS